MGQLEAHVKSEILRLAKREIRITTVPLQRDVRALKGTLFQIRKAIIALERKAAQAQKQIRRETAITGVPGGSEGFPLVPTAHPDSPEAPWHQPERARHPCGRDSRRSNPVGI